MNLHSLVEKNKLLKKIDDNIDVFKGIVNRTAQGKKVLIITDKGETGKNVSIALAYGYFSACESLGVDNEIILQKPKKRGDKAGRKVIKALTSLEKGNVIILCLSNRLGKIGGIGKSFRRFAENHKHIYMSSTSLGSISNRKIKGIIEALDCDYGKLKRKSKILKGILDRAKKIQIKTKRGTDLTIDVDGIDSIANDGDYAAKGGNIPAGEVYMPTKDKSRVEGKIVIDISAASRKGTINIKKPIVIEVKKGSVVDIQGGNEALRLEKTLRWAENRAKHPEYITKVSEIGFGLNEKAKPLGSTLIDEKSYGTAHIALGSNYWFGGSIYGILHLDLVFSKPILIVDGKEINMDRL